MADKGQRTEQPTPRRIQQARKEGNFPVSREFVTAVQFIVFVGVLSAFTAGWLADTRHIIAYLLTAGHRAELDRGEVLRLFQDAVLPVFKPLLVAAVLLMAVTFGAHLSVTRLGFSFKKLAPNWKRLDPVQKLKGLPRQNVPQFFYALFLLPLFCAAVYSVASGNLPALLSLPLLSVEGGLAKVGIQIKDLLWQAAGLFLVLGSVDLYRQLRRYRKDLLMTKQEIRDEFKETEGNPHIKIRIRRLQRDLLRRQMMRQVPKATAVVVNPTHYAVAIRYQMESMAAPKVVAKGKNYLALRIRQKALEHQVPIVENPPLAQALYKSAEVGQEIPAHLYRAVAEILAYIYRLMQGRLPG